MAQSLREPYAGSSRKLIISIDIGTTFTAASFCILQPGKVAKFEEVLRWPKQATPDAKVPSVLYYDKAGNPRAFGAETEDEDMKMEAESHEWFKAAWWKLHMRPAHLPIIKSLSLPDLPPKLTVDNVFADHLRYIKDQIKDYLVATYGEGLNIWTSLYPTMYVILTTPNGWEGKQQNRMREAAIAAGLVDATGGRRIRFVTEAEAAVLYAIDTGSVSDWLVKDGHLILCDCGGGTVDITGYRIESLEPLRLAESSASRCYLAGAVFVNQAMKAYLKERLAGTEWDNNEALTEAVQNFEKNAKKKFDDIGSVSWIPLGGFKSVPALGITRGRLRISGEDMASFFEPSIKSIKEGLDIAFENGGKLADKVILVGGLASSPWVYSQLLKWGEESGISVSRPDGPTVKAVANGALAWHIDNTVSTRYTKCHYGIRIREPYRKDDPEHRGRVPFTGADGVEYVSPCWNGIVPKNEKIDAGKEFTQSFNFEATEGDDLNHPVDIYVYRRATPPAFITFPGKKVFQPGFEVICTVRGNLEKCYRASEQRKSPLTGEKYRKVNFDVCISLGETEISARLRWIENGKAVYGPATVAYD
ncbi:hypothetical protein PLICRDRAFT_701534 [Plicaturopsis crispa FD-325 SS-3]|uniref:Actin-like ATPase domain-containing protein n=1 Tax=Plicaturopsis crispa FD-325 SS-3 TaxID=944288 RepID=A0A0C9T985_PLICR|nr:hypothetical protein PLICRDRAFT_701534 [Plicaturopsis crispa FD-325 SS-3]